MTFDQFKAGLKTSAPAGLPVYLAALWYDANNDWDKSHELIQDLSDENAAWIHAYLHRKEGDIWNADYWYHKAGKKRPDTTLSEEWEQIARALLES